MATYKAIKGLTIQTVAGDPSNLGAGDIWYDSAARKVQGAKLAAGAWSSGGNMNTSTQAGGGNGAAQTAAWVASGRLGPPSDPAGLSVNNEHYDGTSWTEQANVNAGKTGVAAGIGTTTASLIAGGEGDVAASEEYNGTAWAEGNDLQQGRSIASFAGLQTAGLVAGGFFSSAAQGEVEEYDGTSWSEQNDLNTARQDAAGCGIQTAAFAISGTTGSLVKNVEQYDGTSWTEVADVNTARTSTPVGFGTVAAAIFCAGGTPGASALTEEWNGTSWAEVADIPAGYRFSQGGGTSSAGVRMSGANPTPTQSAVTDEWTGPAAAAVTFTSS